MPELATKIQSLLRRTRERYIAVETSTGILVTLTALLLGGIVLAALNAIFYMGPHGRTVLLIFYILIVILIFIAKVVSPIVQKPNFRQIAIEIEKKIPELGDMLISAYDLLTFRERDARLGYSDMITYSVVEEAVQRGSLVRAGAVARTDRLMDGVKLFLLTLLVLTLVFQLFPVPVSRGAYAAFHPNAVIPREYRTHIAVAPGNCDVAKYADLTIRVKTTGEIPERISLIRKFGQEKNTGEAQTVKTSVSMQPDSFGIFRFTMKEVKRSFSYTVEAGDNRTRWFDVRVLDKPRIVGIKLTLHYPAYSGLGVQSIEQGGEIDALRGTIVSIDARVGKPLKEGRLALSWGDTIRMEKSGSNTLHSSIRVMRDGSYTILCTDLEELTNSDPIEYRIRVRDDDYPVVRIAMPGRDVDLTEEMRLPMQIIGEDDFGFSRFDLAFYITRAGAGGAAQSDTTRIQLPFSMFKKPQVLLQFVWNLSDMDLIPEDVVHYFIVGYDNDRISGPKTARSREYAARFPSVSEIVEQVRKEQIGETEDLAKLKQQEQKLQKQMNQIKEQMAMDKNNSLSYEKKQQLQTLLDKQKDIHSTIEKLSEQLQNTIEKIQENRLASQEIVAKMLEIQQIMQQIATPEMKEAMRKLQEALKNMDPNRLREAMKDFQMNQQEMLDKLDNTLKLLKRFQMEQRLSELIKMADEAAQMQEKLNKQYDKNENLDEAGRKQNSQSDRLKTMEEEMSKLAEQMKEFEDTPKNDAQQLADKMQSEQNSSLSQQISQSASRGNNKMCSSSGKKLASNISDISKQLQSLQDKMNSNLQKKLAADMEKAAQQLLYISRKQEELWRKGQQSFDRKNIQSIAQGQEQIKGELAEVLNQTKDIASNTFLLPPAVISSIVAAQQASENALDQYIASNTHKGTAHQENALGNINLAADMLLSSMDKMCNSSSSCPSGSQGFFKQLEKISQGQQQLNQQTLPMMGACQNPGGLSPEQQAAAARLAAQQEALRQSLEKLQSEYEQSKNLLGDLGHTAQNMKEVEQDLRKGQITERTLQHQERILSRLLDAQRSLHKQDYTNKRISSIGKDVVRKSPPPVPDDLAERKDILQQEMLRAMSEPHPKEYEDAIKDYFIKLQNLNTERVKE